MLSKEYWYGQNQRLNYLERVGDLFDTRAVVELASDAFKTIRLSLMLISDAVEREAGLTLAQREIIDRMMHAALETMREKLVDGLEQSRGSSRSKAFTQSAKPVSESGDL
jgi:purine-nucleoside phosphorylase